MIFIKNGTINTITNGIIKGDILIENKKRQIRANLLPFLILNKDIEILLEKSISTKYILYQ